MNWSAGKAFSAALLIGGTVAGVQTLATSPAFSAAAVKVENKALAEAINGAQADAKAGKYADALAKAKVADGIQGKGPQLTMQVHQMIVAYALQAKQPNDALDQLDKMIKAGEGDKQKNLSDALGIALQTNNKARADAYIEQLGTNLNPQTRMFIAQGYVKAKRYKEGLDMVAPLRDMPSENLLLFLQATYNEMNDATNRRAVLEQLAANYPKLQYWHDLLQLARNERGLNDEQQLDVLRLRFAVGDLKSDSDYQEMAQLALVAGYPNEAKTLLDKAAVDKIVSGERADRLIKMTNDRVTADKAAVSELEKKAAADPNASVKLGLTYWSYGKTMEAETAIRNGMKGKLTDPEGAKQALGHVLLSEGKRPEAAQAFGSVAKTNAKQSNISRLWAIFARQNPPKEEPTARGKGPAPAKKKA
jgi:hypothetical protein